VDLPGSGYFFALAALAMTFVGFSAIVITFRQGTGLPLTPLQILTTSQYIELGFMAAGFAMLGPLLALCGLPEGLVWRLTSLVIIAVRTPSFVVYPKRRKLAAPDEELPLRYKINVAIFAAIAILLLMNAIGVPFPPSPAPVAIAASHTLLVATSLFVRTFTLFLRH
jgi:hypothetical protein